MSQMFKSAKLRMRLRPYEILATSPGCGIIEFLPNTFSLDYIKRKVY